MDGKMQRLLATLVFGALCGGIIGAYAMSTLYGRRVSSSRPSDLGPQSPDQLACPLCPKCPSCPPPVDCKVEAPVIAPGQDTSIMEDLGEGLTDVRAKPGLSANAMVLAVSSLKLGVQDCQTSTLASEWSGSVVLDLTITATAGWGRVREAVVVQSDGEVLEFGQCLIEAAQNTKFEWLFSDGEGRLRQAFSVKP
jgi:hypothetical protein